MAIHDVDMRNADRGTPTPNSADQLIGPQKNHGTYSIHPKTAASIGKAFIQTKNAQILTFDGSTNRLLINPTQIKISQDGFDVTTATDNQLIFNSSQDVFKIVSKVLVSVTVTPNGSTTNYNSATTAHGLGYTPAFIAMTIMPSGLGANNPNTNHSNPGMAYGLVGGVFRALALSDVTVDATNVYFAAQMDGSFSTGSYTYMGTVYLLQETFS